MNKMIARMFQWMKNPLHWLILFFLLIGISRTISFGDKPTKLIASDGRGYYAYLPAIFIQQDPTFQKTLEAENKYIPFDSQHYIIETAEHGNGILSENHRFNKCFPGIAVLQLPFFGIAYAVEYFHGNQVTGYSATFTNLFFLGQLFYALLGFFLFVKCVEQLFPKAKYVPLFVALIYLATPLLFYSIEAALSHSYTFFLYGVFTFSILKLTKNPSSKYFLILGIVLGLIALTRPTNLIVVLIIPFLLGSWEASKSFLRSMFANRAKNFLIASMSFGLIISIQLFVWKWQSGQWFFWAYNGEGLNWNTPKIWQSLFSFRTGLFLHTPLMVFAVIGTVFLFKKSAFKFTFWWMYFLLNLYIISCWWCWDYETPFGHRPFTEHLFFLVLPLFYLHQWKPKLMFVVLICCASLGTLRYLQFTSGSFTDQRFTKEIYFKSLQFWKPWNYDRWNFTQACEPFGKLIFEEIIASIPEKQSVTSENEFIASYEVELAENHLDTRYFVAVELDKQLLSESWENVFLIKDAYSSTTDKRNYSSMKLYNDKLEGKYTWSHIILSEALLDNFSEYDRLKIYIWNPGKQSFETKNLSIKLQQYKAN